MDGSGLRLDATSSAMKQAHGVPWPAVRKRVLLRSAGWLLPVVEVVSSSQRGKAVSEKPPVTGKGGVTGCA
jgi:hypothetical protein